MPKNVLFSLKLVKIAKRCGQILCLRRDPHTIHPPWWFFSLRLPTRTDSFGNDQCLMFYCNYNGVERGFRRRKNYAAFRTLKITEIITIVFNFFVLSFPTHFVLVPPLYTVMYIN